MASPAKGGSRSVEPARRARTPRFAAAPGALRKGLGDVVFQASCTAGAILVVVTALCLVVVLVDKSWLAMQTVGMRFFTDRTWDPEPSHRQFGALAFVYGTIATSVIAMVIAVPLGVGTAAFLAEIAPGWLRRAGSFLVEMLAAIPSVVYGFWGLFVMAPALQRVISALGGPNQGGIGILPAGLILSIMIVPYVAAVSYDVCRAVPRSQREASLALGASRWQTIWSVVLPYARPGIIGGCFIALGRALGETMAVTMLIGNRPDISLSPFAMGNSIASVIANEFTEATYDLYLSALAELGLVLLLVSVIVNTLARLLIRRMQRPRNLDLLAGGGPGLNGFLVRERQAPARRASASPVRTASARFGARTEFVNRAMTFVLGLLFAVTVGPLFLILGHLLVQGFQALNWSFFVNLPAPVGETGGGMANALCGSAILVALATAFAVPVGLLAAVYLVEFRGSRLSHAVRFIGELLGGVPSIVIGIFAYSLVVKPMGHFSGWAGGFALGIMMIPIVMRASEEALKLVPRALRDASYALGAERFQTVLRVCVPAALPAIVTAVFLGIARIGGETAPLLLTASSNQYWPSSPNDFMPSLPVYIFTYAVSPYEDWHRQAWAAALVLLIAVMLLNFGVRVVTGKRVIQASRAD
jgi:phosphate transport system permease protein